MKNRYGPIIVLWVLTAALSWTAAQEIFVQPLSASYAVTAPGNALTGPFEDAMGEGAELPETGRHLVWLVDAAFALETRERIARAELDPQADPSESLLNPTATLMERLTPSADAYVIFYEGYGALPDAGERLEAAERLAAFTVLFDEAGFLSDPVAEGSLSFPPRVEGLYLMEGRTVAYRFFGPGLWDGWGASDLVLAGAEAFLEGGEPAVTPVPAAAGARLPDDVLPAGSPALVLRVSGDAAEAPAWDGDTALVEAGVNSRYLLETLPPLLGRYGVRGVALVPEPGRVAELSSASPDWTFVATERPEERLTWLEVQALLVGAEGEVAASMLLFTSNTAGPYAGWLERRLREISSR